MSVFKRVLFGVFLLLTFVANILFANDDFKSISVVGQYGDYSSVGKDMYVGVVYKHSPNFKATASSMEIDLKYILYLEKQSVVFDEGRFSLLLSKEEVELDNILISDFKFQQQRFKASWLSDINFIYEIDSDNAAMKLNQNVWLYVVLIDADLIEEDFFLNAYQGENFQLSDPIGDETHLVDIVYSAKLSSVPYAYSSYVAESLLTVDSVDIPDPLYLSNMLVKNYVNINNLFKVDFLQKRVAVDTDFSAFSYDLAGSLNVNGELFQNGINVYDTYFSESDQGVSLNANFSRVGIYPNDQQFVFVQEQPYNFFVDGAILLTGNTALFVEDQNIFDLLNAQWATANETETNFVYTTHNKVGILTNPVESLDVNGGIYLSSENVLIENPESGIIAYSASNGFSASISQEAEDSQWISLHRFTGKGKVNKLLYPSDDYQLSFIEDIYLGEFSLGLNTNPLALLHLKYQSINNQAIFMIGDAETSTNYMRSDGTWFVGYENEDVAEDVRLSVSSLNASMILIDNVPIRYYFLVDYAEDFRLSIPNQDLISNIIFNPSDALFYNAYWDVNAEDNVTKNMYVHIANDLIPTENAQDVMPGTVLFLGSMTDFNRFDFPAMRFFNDQFENKRYFDWRAYDSADHISADDHNFYFELSSVDPETNQTDILMRFVNSFVGFNTFTPSADFSLVGDGFLVQEEATSLSQLPLYLQDLNNPFNLLFIPYSDDLYGENPSEDKHYFVFLVGNDLLNGIPDNLMSAILMGKSHQAMVDMVVALGGSNHLLQSEYSAALGGSNISVAGSHSVGLGSDISLNGNHSFIWSGQNEAINGFDDHQFLIYTQSLIINKHLDANDNIDTQLLLGPRPFSPTDFYNDAFLAELNFLSLNEAIQTEPYDPESLQNMSIFLWSYLVSENVINETGSIINPYYFDIHSDKAAFIAQVLEVTDFNQSFRDGILLDDGFDPNSSLGDLNNFLEPAGISPWNYVSPFLFSKDGTSVAQQRLSTMLKKLYYHQYFQFKDTNLQPLLRFQHPAVLKLGYQNQPSYDVVTGNRALFMVDNDHQFKVNVSDANLDSSVARLHIELKQNQDALAIITGNSTFNSSELPTYNVLLTSTVPEVSFWGALADERYRLFISSRGYQNTYSFLPDYINLDIFNDLTSYVQGDVSANLQGIDPTSIGVRFWQSIETENGLTAIHPAFNSGLNNSQGGYANFLGVHTKDVVTMLNLGNENYGGETIDSILRFSTSNQDDDHLDIDYDGQRLHFRTLFDTDHSVFSLLSSKAVLIGNNSQSVNWDSMFRQLPEANEFSLYVSGPAHFGPNYAFFVTQNLNVSLENSHRLDLERLEINQLQLVTFNPYRIQLYTPAGQGWEYMQRQEILAYKGLNANAFFALLGNDDASNDDIELQFLVNQEVSHGTGVYIAGPVSVNQGLMASSLLLSDTIGVTLNENLLIRAGGDEYKLGVSSEFDNALYLDADGIERMYIGVLSEQTFLENNQIIYPVSFLEQGQKSQLTGLFYRQQLESPEGLWNADFQFEDVFENARNTASLGINGTLHLQGENTLGDVYDIQLADSTLQRSNLIDVTVGQYRENTSAFIDLSTRINATNPDDAVESITVNGLAISFSATTNELLDEAGNFYGYYDTFADSVDLNLIGLNVDMSNFIFSTDVTQVGLYPLTDVFSLITTGHVLISKSPLLPNKYDFLNEGEAIFDPNLSVLGVTGNVEVAGSVNVLSLKSHFLRFFNPADIEDPDPYLIDESTFNKIDVRFFAENAVEGFDLAVEGNVLFNNELTVSNNIEVDKLIFGESTQANSIFQVNNFYVDSQSTLFLTKQESGLNLTHRMQHVDIFLSQNEDEAQHITLYDFTLRSVPQFPVAASSVLTGMNLDMLGFKLLDTDQDLALVGVSVNVSPNPNNFAARFMGGDVLVNQVLADFELSQATSSLLGDDLYVNDTIKANRLTGNVFAVFDNVESVSINQNLDVASVSVNRMDVTNIIPVTVNFITNDTAYLNANNINFEASKIVTVNASESILDVYEMLSNDLAIISEELQDNHLPAFEFNAINNSEQGMVFGSANGDGFLNFTQASQLLIDDLTLNSLIVSSSRLFRVQQFESGLSFNNEGHLRAFIAEDPNESTAFFLRADTLGNYVFNNGSTWRGILLESEAEDTENNASGFVFNQSSFNQQAALLQTSSNFQFVFNQDTPLIISRNKRIGIGYHHLDSLQKDLNISGNLLVDSDLSTQLLTANTLETKAIVFPSDLSVFTPDTTFRHYVDVDVSQTGEYVAHGVHLDGSNNTTPIDQEIFLSKLNMVTGNLLHALNSDVLGMVLDLKSNSILDFTGVSINVSDTGFAALFNGGNVGVSTLEPNAALDILGDFYVSGNFSVKDAENNFLSVNQFESLDLAYLGVTVNRMDAFFNNNNILRPLQDLQLNHITLNIQNRLDSSQDLSLTVISSLNMQGVAGLSVNAVSTLASFNSNFVANAVPKLTADRLFVDQRVLFNDLTPEGAVSYIQTQISQNMWQLLTNNIAEQRIFDIGERPDIVLSRDEAIDIQNALLSGVGSLATTDLSPALSAFVDASVSPRAPAPQVHQLNAQEQAVYLLNRLESKFDTEPNRWEESKNHFIDVIKLSKHVLNDLQTIHDGIQDFVSTQELVASLKTNIEVLLVSINNTDIEYQTPPMDLTAFLSHTTLDDDGNNRYAFSGESVNFYASTLIPAYIKYSFLWYEFFVLAKLSGSYDPADYINQYQILYDDEFDLDTASTYGLLHDWGTVDSPLFFDPALHLLYNENSSFHADISNNDIYRIQAFPDVPIYNRNNFSMGVPEALFHIDQIMMSYQNLFFTDHMYQQLASLKNSLGQNFIQFLYSKMASSSFFQFDLDSHLYDVNYKNQGSGTQVFENGSLVYSFSGVFHLYEESQHILYDVADLSFLIENYLVNVYQSLERINDILQYHVAPTMIISGNVKLGGDQTASRVSIDQFLVDDVTVLSYENSTFDFTQASSFHITANEALIQDAIQIPFFAVAEKNSLADIGLFNLGVVDQDLYFVSTVNARKRAFQLNRPANTQAGLAMVDIEAMTDVDVMDVSYNNMIINEHVSDDLAEMSVSINTAIHIQSNRGQTLSSDFSMFDMDYSLDTKTQEQATQSSDENTYAAMKIEMNVAHLNSNSDLYGLFVDMGQLSRNVTLDQFNFFDSQDQFISSDAVYSAVFKGDVAILPNVNALQFPLRGAHYNQNSEALSFQDYFDQEIQVTENAHLSIHANAYVSAPILRVESTQNILLEVNDASLATLITRIRDFKASSSDLLPATGASFLTEGEISQIIGPGHSLTPDNFNQAGLTTFLSYLFSTVPSSILPLYTNIRDFFQVMTHYYEDLSPLDYPTRNLMLHKAQHLLSFTNSLIENSSMPHYAVGLAHSNPSALLTVTSSLYMKADDQPTSTQLYADSLGITITSNTLDVGELYVSRLIPTADIDMTVTVKAVTVNGFLKLNNSVFSSNTFRGENNNIFKKGIYADYTYDQPFSLSNPVNSNKGLMDISLNYNSSGTAWHHWDNQRIYGLKIDMSKLTLANNDDIASMYSAVFQTNSFGQANNEGLTGPDMRVLAKPRILLTGKHHDTDTLNSIIEDKLISSNYTNNNMAIYQDEALHHGAVSFFLANALKLKPYNEVHRQNNLVNFITDFSLHSGGDGRDAFIVANPEYWQFYSDFYDKEGIYLTDQTFRNDVVSNAGMKNLLNDHFFLGKTFSPLYQLASNYYDFYQLRIDYHSASEAFYFDVNQYAYAAVGGNPTLNNDIAFPTLSMHLIVDSGHLYFNHSFDTVISNPPDAHLFFNSPVEPLEPLEPSILLLESSSFQFLPESTIAGSNPYFNFQLIDDDLNINLASGSSKQIFQIAMENDPHFYLQVLYDNENSNDLAKVNIYSGFQANQRTEKTEFTNSLFYVSVDRDDVGDDENDDLRFIENSGGPNVWLYTSSGTSATPYKTYAATFHYSIPDASAKGAAMAIVLTDGAHLSKSVDKTTYDDSFVEFLSYAASPENNDDAEPMGSFKPIWGSENAEFYPSGVNQSVGFTSQGGDYAEFLPKLDLNQDIHAADVVGLYQGSVSLATHGADKLMVVSNISIIVGNEKSSSDKHLYEQVAFLGQVPVKVRGEARFGQWLIPSGLADGFAVAVNPSLMWSDQVIGQVINTRKENHENQVWALVGFDISRDYVYKHLSQLREQIDATKETIDRLKQNYALFINQQEELEQLLQERGL